MKTILAWIRERCRFAQSDCYAPLNPNSPTFEQAFNKAYECVHNQATSLASGFHSALLGVTSPFQCRVKTDVKKRDATLKKFVAKGKYPTLMDMPDILRSKVLLPVKFERERIADAIVRFMGAEKVENVVTEQGYDAIHIDTIYGGMRAEIQILYKHQDTYKSWAHKEYKKQRGRGEGEGGEADLKRMFELLQRPLVNLGPMRQDRERRYKKKKREEDIPTGRLSPSERRKMLTTEGTKPFNLRVAMSEKGMIDYEKMVEEAREFARQKHRGQKRKHNDEDYFVHPERVALVAQELGLPPEDVAAAYVHDVIEDVPELMGVPKHLRAEAAEKLRLEIEQKFGPQVASMTRDLTNPSKGSPLPRAERKKMDREHVAMVPERVRILKAIDRIDNLRDFMRAGDKVSPKFRRLYAEESRLLADALVQEGASERLLRLVETMRQEADRLGAV